MTLLLADPTVAPNAAPENNRPSVVDRSVADRLVAGSGTPASTPTPTRTPTPTPSNTQAEPQTHRALAAVLKSQAALLAAPNRAVAAQQLSNSLLGAGFDGVALAFVQGSRLVGLQCSTTLAAQAGTGSLLARQLQNAMLEALHQGQALLTTNMCGSTEQAQHFVCAAQHQLLAHLQNDAAFGKPTQASVVCVLLQGGENSKSSNSAQGVLLALRTQAGLAPLLPTDQHLLQHVAAFAAPVLALLHQRDRSWSHRLQQALGAQQSQWVQQTRRVGVASAALCLAVAVLVPMQHHVGGAARVEGSVQRLLVAPHASYLKQVHVRPGDRVQAGQLLVELADQDLLTEQARWASQLEQAQSSQAEGNARGDRNQMVAGMAKVAEAQAQLDLVQAQLERSQITAPFDGLVVQGDLSQRLGAPLAQGAELLTLAPAGAQRVVVEVDERDINQVAVGQTGSLALSALPWDTVALRVVRVSPMASTGTTSQQSSNSNVFEVEAELLQPPDKLRPGLAGVAHIGVGWQPLLADAARGTATRLRQWWWQLWG
jgi:multidrug resistance efflux pump